MTMATRKAITRSLAVRYRDGSRALKADILDTVCRVTGYHRDYARRALRVALKPRVVTPRVARAPKYDANVVRALEKCWAVLNAPAGKRLAPMLAELVPLLRRLPVSPFPGKVGLVGVEGVLDSPAYPRSGPVLRSGGVVRGRVAIAQRRPRRGRP